MSYAEIQNVSHEMDSTNKDIGILKIQTVTDEYIKLKSFDSWTGYKLMSYLLTQLKKRSIYVVALHNYFKEKSSTDTESYLKLKKGDLIMLEKGSSGENLMNSNSVWAYGSCKDSIGYFPIDMVYILPCIQPPKREVLDLFKVGIITFKILVSLQILKFSERKNPENEERGFQVQYNSKAKDAYSKNLCC